MAYTNIASVCHQGKGVRPGSLTKGRRVPAIVSAARVNRKIVPGSVAQNQRRSRTDTMENTAK